MSKPVRLPVGPDTTRSEGRSGPDATRSEGRSGPDTTRMGTLRAWRATVGLSVRAWPLGAGLRLAVGMTNAAGWGFLPALALRAVLDGGGPGWMAVLVGGTTASIATGPLFDWTQRGLIWRANQAAAHAVMGAALAPAGIDHLENPRFADAMEVVRSNRRGPGLLFDWMAGVAGALVSLSLSLVVLASVHPLLLVPVVGSAALGLAHAATRRRAILVSDRSLPGQRLAQRLVELGTAPGPAKEIRTLGLGPWLSGRHRAVTDDVARRMVEGERGPVLASAVSGLAQAILLGLGIAWLVRLAATGRATTGDLALGLVLLRVAVEEASGFGRVVGSDLARNTHMARHYLWLLEYQPSVVAPADPRPVPAVLRSGIEVANLRFCYPGSTSPALDGVSLTMPAGTTVALVGDNGAGKSTLVKLLCRFYDPSEGAITVDGTDLRALDLDGWRRASTGAYQDFMRFRFLARQSVGVGELPAAEDGPRVMAAAAAGGAAPFLEALPEGYGTQLGRDFPGGADLSEGQWQKVALSRSLMRARPLLVLLDEPTAALDARAEHELFECYAARAADARAWGGVTVLVSHRFSTVRMADLIVVLDGGRLVESGTHAELIAAAGRYAELYSLQADRYR